LSGSIGIQMRWYPDALVSRCAGIQMRWYPDALFSGSAGFRQLDSSGCG